MYESCRRRPLASSSEGALSSVFLPPPLLTQTDPKRFHQIRWNAALASSSLLSVIAPLSKLTSLVQRLSAALSTLLLTDSSFKARIHAVGALSVVTSPSTEVKAAVRRAKEALEEEVEGGRVPGKEKGHAEVLMKRVRLLFSVSTSP
jgi:hypothetical protein